MFGNGTRLVLAGLQARDLANMLIRDPFEINEG